MYIKVFLIMVDNSICPVDVLERTLQKMMAYILMYWNHIDLGIYIYVHIYTYAPSGILTQICKITM